MVVVPKDGAEIDKADFLKFFEGKVAKFCQPDDMVLVTELPLTATGKLQKRQLREQFKDFVLQTVAK
jgi:fatty-acyl-CoA synthase